MGGGCALEYLPDDPRLVLEVALVRITRRDSRTRDESLVERVERIE